MPATASSEEIAQKVCTVSDLSREALVERWTSAYGRPPPKGISRRLLERSAAYHLQLEIIGDFPANLRHRLARLDRGARTGTPADRKRPAATLSPGTRLVREWNGRTHSVEVTESGFLWNGRSWGSLSAVATAITGARWSGPRFFGL